MNLRRSIFAWLLVAVLARSGFGEGITYPDGSVSTFKPGFIEIGIPGGATESYVFGVAAQGGMFLGAVGQINGPLTSGDNFGHAAFFWGPNGSHVLPGPSGATGSSTASGISADGKIKVGDAGGATYWDANDQRHSLLSTGDLGTSGAAAITSDGSLIAGSVVIEQRSEDARFVSEAALWAPGVATPKKLGILPSFDATTATGISEQGATVCGYATKYIDENNPAGRIRAFVYRNSTLQSLGTLNGDEESLAYGISQDASLVTRIVGTSGTAGVARAVLWRIQSGGEIEIERLQDASAPSAAFAVRVNSDAPDGTFGRIVGYINLSSELREVACMWNMEGRAQGFSIKDLLERRYKVGDALKWHLTRAYALSADGCTVAGAGFNPEGKTEGWIAVMPPFLHPPILVKPPNMRPRPGEPYFFQVDATNDPDRKATYTAKNLPKGFKISSSGLITGLWSSDQTDIIGNHTVTVFATNKDGTGSKTFTMSLELPPDATTPQKSQSIEGHGFLPQNKPPGEETFLASFANGTSSNGQVAVGQDRLFNDARAYRWTATDGAAGLPMLDGALRTYSTASAVSADGNTIVGQSAAAPADDGSNRSVATVWKTLPATTKALRKNERHYAESETAPPLDAINLGLFQGGIISLATGVSSDGSVVVGYGDGKDPDPSFGVQLYQAFRWTESGGMVGLGWIDQKEKFSQAWGVSPDGSIIVGTDAAQAFRWTEAEGMVGLGKGSGALGCRANGVSADNSTIIGFNTYNDANDNNRAFRWTAGEGFIDLGVLPGAQYSEAKAISADGSVIIGLSGIKFGSSRAFIWDKTNGMRDLKLVLVAGNPGLANWTLRSATGISADGKTIVGTGTNPNGDTEGFTAVLEVHPAQLLNISTRMRVLTGDKVLIGGFIITGTDPKKVMIRGVGPSLGNAGLQGVMADPTLELHQGRATVARNDNWKTRPDGSSQQAEIEATTIPPGNDLESAIVMTLNPGQYTAILAEKDGGSGLGIAEVYDLSQGGNSRLANISTRGFVDVGDNIMIGGFIVGGGTAGAFAGEIVRAIGPSLSSSGVADSLQDPTLELYDSNGVLLASNDNWKTRPDGSSQESDIQASTIPPPDERESAIVASLAPGNYTAVVRGKGNSTGVAVVEAFQIQ